MYRLNYYSIALIGVYILAFIIMQYGGGNNWTEGLFSLPVIAFIVFWSEKMTGHLKHQKNRQSLMAFGRDVFIINYSVVFSFVASLIFQRNNVDARGWWPVLIIMSEFYAILFGLVFAVLALLLKTQHDKYTERFAQALAISFISLTFLPFYFNLGPTDHIHTSTIWMILLFSVHLFACLVSRLRKKPSS
ncbi:hypothetical protein [Legionella geestiana]|uniref:hypothetical protein n=1 Tax=Legionella geestiana TaxID=45065 RepID=UPI00068532EB|nr:hypothetical protein [Legionella geestiana]QBS13491.1 hypothetical protein E4T54_11675 [Legionella geestiana]STX59166.1 Uncharacterised protein [Legionella geestiana]